MKFTKNSLKSVLLLSIFFTLIISWGISFPLTSDTKITVAVTNVSQIEWVEEIGGDHIEVFSLVPEGSDLHTYEPTSNDLASVATASVWFQIGFTEFDIAHEQAIIDATPSSFKVVNLSVGLNLLGMVGHHEHEEEEHEHAAVDPHIWLSPNRVIDMSQKISETLSEIDAAHAFDYENNAQIYINELTELDDYVTNLMSTVQNKHMLVFHPAWNYFCDDYGLELIALEEEGKDPTSQHYAEVLTEVREKQVGVIFTQDQISEESAKAFASDACVEVIQINPFPLNYIDDLKATAETISKNLDQAPQCNDAIPSFPLLFLLVASIGTIMILTIGILGKFKKQR